jgi:hypothetical protein
MRPAYDDLSLGLQLLEARPKRGRGVQTLEGWAATPRMGSFRDFCLEVRKFGVISLDVLLPEVIVSYFSRLMRDKDEPSFAPKPENLRTSKFWFSRVGSKAGLPRRSKSMKTLRKHFRDQLDHGAVRCHTVLVAAIDLRAARGVAAASPSGHDREYVSRRFTVHATGNRTWANVISH